MATGIFSGFFSRAATDEEIEASQLDHFSSDQRIEHLKTILGQEFIKDRQEYLSNITNTTRECEALMFPAKEYPIYAKMASGYFMACYLRKSKQFSKDANRMNCFTDGYLDELLKIDELLKEPPRILEKKLDEFNNRFSHCLLNPNSDAYGKAMEIMSQEDILREKYSGILSNPQEIEILKSKHLPNTTIIEKKRIESELMKPLVYNPKTDSEMDFDRKLMELSKTQFFKHDIELVKKCYQSKEPKIRGECFNKYFDVWSKAKLVICKREVLVASNQFPNIEDAAATDLETGNGVCHKLFMRNGIEKLFPNMPEFTKNKM